MLYGANIASGCIVGFASFVNKEFPANLVLAGCPAKIIKEDVAWVREGKTFITEKSVFLSYRFI